jgi:hypothetical protein
LFSPVEKAFASNLIAIVPKSRGSRTWVLKVVDPALFNKDIFAEMSKSDLNTYKVVGEPLLKLWKKLNGNIVFETEVGSEKLLYRRLLWMEARLVEWKGEKQGWSKGERAGPGYISMESFSSDDGEGGLIKELALIFDNVSLATTSVAS